MEDALVQTFTIRKVQPSLNPCFNGRCTRTGIFIKYTERKGNES